jgi:hypothetical protein
MDKGPVFFTSSIISRVLNPNHYFRSVLYGPSPMPTLIEEIRRKGLDKCRIGLMTLRGIPYGHVT